MKTHHLLSVCVVSIELWLNITHPNKYRPRHNNKNCILPSEKKETKWMRRKKINQTENPNALLVFVCRKKNEYRSIVWKRNKRLTNEILKIVPQQHLSRINLLMHIICVCCTTDLYIMYKLHSWFHRIIDTLTQTHTNVDWPVVFFVYVVLAIAIAFVML